jgi:uncharacterized hydantoinase/oxoprolinase family protein
MFSESDFLYKNSSVCTATASSLCDNNKTAGEMYLDLVNKVSAAQTKKNDINRLYVRELIYTGNMVLGIIGLMLYIKYNK